jgi:hypothetical protein
LDSKALGVCFIMSLLFGDGHELISILCPCRKANFGSFTRKTNLLVP